VETASGHKTAQLLRPGLTSKDIHSLSDLMARSHDFLLGCVNNLMADAADGLGNSPQPRNWGRAGLAYALAIGHRPLTAHDHGGGGEHDPATCCRPPGQP
jgi:hypothetical protein